MLTIAEALEYLQTAIRPITALERVSINSALGRILGESMTSPINIPFDRNAAMDGYAFNSVDINHEDAFTLIQVGTSWAGEPYQGRLETGQCIRIFTGAALPEEADSVIMQEQVQTDGKTIFFAANAAIKQNVRAIGEDIKQGDYLIQSPKKLTASDLGLLASAGINEVLVTRPLKIACFSTGNELLPIGQTLSKGKIYDSNRYSLAALLSDPCYRVTDFGIVADNKSQLTECFINAAKNHDVIITTGGASVGEADYISDILASCGTINFWKIAMKPGKPLAFGTIDNCYFFGLPGNPVAVVTTLQQIVAPALRNLCGSPKVKPLRLKATLTNRIKKSSGREEFQRGILTQDENNNFFVSCSAKQGSHILSSMSQANCFIILPKMCDGMESGEIATVEPFDRFI